MLNMYLIILLLHIFSKISLFALGLCVWGAKQWVLLHWLSQLGSTDLEKLPKLSNK